MAQWQTVPSGHHVFHVFPKSPLELPQQKCVFGPGLLLSLPETRHATDVGRVMCLHAKKDCHRCGRAAWGERVKFAFLGSMRAF